MKTHFPEKKIYLCLPNVAVKTNEFALNRTARACRMLFGVFEKPMKT